jgi:hypothetical protein
MVRYIAWMCMILAAAAAQAQEAQRLQYRTDGQPEKSLGVYAEVRVRAEPSPPAELALPKLAGDRPLFARWITPMVPAGHLWLALDHPAPARDGASIAFTPAQDVPTGTLRLDVPQAQLTVGGENGLLYLNVAEGKVSAPAGKYRLTVWKTEKADGSGAPWRAEGTVIPGEAAAVDVREGQETRLAVGEPFVCKGADTVRDRGTHSLSLRLRGRLDEPIYLYRDGRQAAPPQVRIASADKTYDQAFATEYG